MVTGLITFCAMRMAIALRASEHVMRRRSVRMDTVIILYLGTSDMSLSYVDCSKRTWLFAFSLFFPFDHFFFLPLPPAMALAALAAFDSGALGGCWSGEEEEDAVSNWFLSFARCTAVKERAARRRRSRTRARRGEGWTPRRDGSFRGSEGVATRAPRRNRRSRARSGPRRASGKTGFRSRRTDGIRRTRASAVAARSARHGIDFANTVFRLEIIPCATRGSETRHVARCGAGRDVPRARALHKP